MLKNEFLCQLENETDLSAYTSRHSGDKTVAYKTVNGEKINLSVFFPENFESEEKLKTLIIIHGGGWSSHKIFDDQNGLWQGDYLGFLARYYADKGLLCVSVDYRLARNDAQEKDYQLTDLYSDCCDAVKYIYNIKDELKIDENDVSILGESAGGYLAAAVVTLPFIKLPFKFKKAYLINAITNLYDHWHKAVPQNTDFEPLKDLSEEERTKALSPLDNITSCGFETVLVHGDCDTCVDPTQSRKFHEKSLETGNVSKLYRLPNTGHAFLLEEYTTQKKATAAAIKILDKEIL